MSNLRVILIICAICLLVIYTVRRLLCKLLKYKSIRKPRSLADLVSLLAASTYELQVEAERCYQIDNSVEPQRSKFSLDELLQDELRRRTQVDHLMVALNDSPFFKNLGDAPLRALAEELQAGEQNAGTLCDCIYQSDNGIEDLFVMPPGPDRQSAAAVLKLGGGEQFDVGGRVMFSPSALICALLGVPCPVKFHCTLHGNYVTSFWSVSYTRLTECLSAWPEVKMKLLQQFWSHVNEVLLLVFVEWLNLDALNFLEAAGYDSLLERTTDQLAEEFGAEVFAGLSFYEKRRHYQKLALRMLHGIAGVADKAAAGKASAKVTVKFYSAGETVPCRTAFLVLDGRLEAVTHPTLSRQFATAWQSTVSCRRIPGCIGLLPYFSHTRLPFDLRAASSADGAILGELPDHLMDDLFGSMAAPLDAATSFLVMQLNRQVFRHDLLLNYRRLHRGDHLVRCGDSADTVEVVVSGRLRHKTAELCRGDCLGLVEGLIDCAERCWARDVVAVRESRAVSVPLGLVRAWLSQNHRRLILDRILGVLCERELDRQWASGGHRDPAERGHRGALMIGVMADATQFNQPAVLQLLSRALHGVHGDSARLVSEADLRDHFGRPADQLPEAAVRNWLEEQELLYPTLLLTCSSQINRWTRLVMGFLDSLVVCCDVDSDSGESPSDAEEYFSQMFRCRIYLAVFHALTLCPVPAGTSLRFQRRRRRCGGGDEDRWVSRVFHVRCCTAVYKAAGAPKPDDPRLPRLVHNSDLARLIRSVTGRAVGLAFGDGGPRGLANIGALEALLEQKVAVDLVAGSGLGALVAAAWALHHGDLAATRKSVEQLWTRLSGPVNALSDLTLPLVSSFKGARLNAALRHLFGPFRQAEDLWLPFVAVSTDLIAAQAVAHTTGTVWRSVRASCGRVGVYPPVWEPRTGRLLVDGVHTDRLPARTLRTRLSAGRVVAVALEDKARLRLGSYRVYGDDVSGVREFARSLNPFRVAPLAPRSADIQMALTSLAGSDELDVDDDDGSRGDDAPWCLTVKPDPSFSISAAQRVAAERWRGYWAVKRRLRRTGAEQRAALHGYRD